MEPSDSTVLACKTGRVSFKANQLCNYNLKLLLGIERFRLSSAQERQSDCDISDCRLSNTLLRKIPLFFLTIVFYR